MFRTAKLSTFAGSYQHLHYWQYKNFDAERDWWLCFFCYPITFNPLAI